MKSVMFWVIWLKTLRVGSRNPQEPKPGIQTTQPFDPHAEIVLLLPSTPHWDQIFH